MHHKFSETDADPQNAMRGFFFSHIGWLMVKKHPDVIERGRTVDCSDILDDPIVRFQRKYYLALVVLIWGFLPTAILYYVAFLEKEPLWFCFCVNIFRYVLSLHCTWSVNSWAHLYGMAPYDINMQAKENRLVSFFTYGEGYHNYHHVFPWDYSASEFGWKSKAFCYNFMCLHFIFLR